jgi:hypothetical protein
MNKSRRRKKKKMPVGGKDEKKTHTYCGRLSDMFELNHIKRRKKKNQ